MTLAGIVVSCPSTFEHSGRLERIPASRVLRRVSVGLAGVPISSACGTASVLAIVIRDEERDSEGWDRCSSCSNSGWRKSGTGGEYGRNQHQQMERYIDKMLPAIETNMLNRWGRGACRCPSPALHRASEERGFASGKRYSLPSSNHLLSAWVDRGVEKE